MAKKITKNFADVVKAELAADPELAREVEEARLHADIAEQVMRLRVEAKLTQKQLAEMIGTKQSVISRIEDADYYGHSLKMLQRLAEALSRRITVVFCPLEPWPTASAGFAVNAGTTVAKLENA